jgi:hypothetical protein
MAKAAANPIPRFSVVPAKTAAERLRIYQFRYRVHTEQYGSAPIGADREKKAVSDAGDETGTHLCLLADDQLAATIRISAIEQVAPGLLKHLASERFAEFPRAAMSSTSHLTVAKEWRRGQVLSVILGAAYKMARSMKSRFDFAASPPALVPLYEQLGYRRYADNFEDENGEYMIPLVLLTEDVEHLAKVGSPLARIAAEYENTPQTSRWFAAAFKGFVGRSAKAGVDEDKFWDYLTERLSQTPLDGIPLLRGLKHAEAKRLLNEGRLIRGKAGEAIVRSGDKSREMFVVLQGEVDVKSANRTLSTLKRGAIFGETALITAAPRTADVVAKTDVEALALSEDFLRKTMASIPDIMVRVLFNLSMILAERLAVTTKSSAAPPS